MNGKDKCMLLKTIRIRLAELNNIEYKPHYCNNSDDCSGTCEMCDNESKRILQEMKRLERKGFPIIYSLNGIDDPNLDKNKSTFDSLDSINNSLNF